MKFKVGQRVRINTFDNVFKKVEMNEVNDINLSFFRDYENEAGIIKEITEDNYAIIYIANKDLKISIPERHFPYAFKNYTSIELDEKLFEL